MRCEAASEGNGNNEMAKLFTGEEEVDDSELKLNTAIFRESDSVYRLMMLVSTGVVLRVFDPTEVLNCLLNSRMPLCSCHNNQDSEVREARTAARVYRLEDILEEWNSISPQTDIQVTRILCDYLKVNVALALSGTGVVMTDVRLCCLECAIEEAIRELKDYYPRRVIRTQLVNRALTS
ncbi:hypothetical protein FPOAC1_003807 [Fusarium poae]|uniref:hypothetical protein n=1 Tax=Fusarium poae TaxID=36050 RepID=UPI001CE8E095|nr:hypothetical protein FPOAC1_003807 [Fusarium poae]KAG8677779.1 hypothetical protein FPOAC1_003807 [Fusarium poae]